MTISASPQPIHPILAALGWMLPMAADTSWTLTRLGDTEPAPAACRFTLTEAGDLLVELPAASHGGERYVFDAQGQLVSLSHERYFTGPLFDHLCRQVLATVRERCFGSGQPGQAEHPP